MKKVLSKGISVLLTGWVLSAPLLVSAHSTVYHGRPISQTEGFCTETCADDEHRGSSVHHDWCQVRVFTFLKNFSDPLLFTHRFSAYVTPLEASPRSFLFALLPPSRASPLV